ncbi:MAG: Holliday junction branch migration protein RuvA [Patescibacteria group bacterium]
MIGSLRGRVLEIHGSFVLLETNGVGYAVKISASVLTHLKTGEEKFLYIHHHVREDQEDLYGFLSYDEQEFFERLIAVSGVGPKVAQTIMSTGSIDSLRRAVMQGDLDFLTSVPGVGKKTAQKIILELKGQLVEAVETPLEEREVIEALVSLGYSVNQAKEAVKTLSPDTIEVTDKVREALRHLAP